MNLRSRIETNLKEVRYRMVSACRRAGRAPDSVTLVAVTKLVTVNEIRALYDLGQREMGESRPQALWDKHPQVPSGIHWHMIGHLQTNKVRRTLPMVTAVDSVDRWSLVETLSAEATRIERRVPVLLEANVTGEVAKHGFSPDELREAYPRLIEVPGLDVRGLMTMAMFEADAERCRPTFRTLRGLRDELRERFPDGPGLPRLSMGMTNDFEIAIEEGATEVRIGSALFEGLRL